jgi:hypothetical protein
MNKSLDNMAPEGTTTGELGSKVENFEMMIARLEAKLDCLQIKDDAMKKSKLIEALDDEKLGWYLKMKNKETMTYENVTEKLKEKYKKLHKKETILQKISRILLVKRQEYGQSTGNYINEMIKEAGELDIRMIIAIISATCHKTVYARIEWQRITTISDLKMQAELVDRKITLENKKKTENNSKSEKWVNTQPSKFNKNDQSSCLKILKKKENVKVNNDVGNQQPLSRVISPTLKVPKLQEKVTEEFLRKEFETVCNMNMASTGYTGMECEIKTPPGKIVKAKATRVKASMLEKVDKEIDNLETKGYIKDSESKWRNPIRPVIKPDESVRMCMNMMALNTLVEKDEEDIPRIEDILDKMQGNRYFTVIDLKEGYFQIRIAEQDKEKTAFEINDKKYEWNRMPMGFKNAPMIFQRIMKKELKELIHKGVEVYLDDIVIYSKDENEHDSILMKVMSILEEKNLKINMEKIQLKKPEVLLLGRIVNGEHVRIPEEQREEILTFKEPKTKTDLQRFLGTINYHSRFIDNYGEKTAKLYEILKDNKTMGDWTDEHSKQFTALQEEINREVIRYHPDYKKDFILETDASNTGVGAILLQIGKNGEKKVIKPAAKKFAENETKWGITEKELFAVIWAIRRFDEYLRGRKFHLITDHKALEWMKSKEDFGNAKIQKWLEEIYEYDFTVEYRKGEEMGEADALSRQYKENDETNEATKQQEEAILKAHIAVGHRGIDTTEYELVRSLTKWPKQKEQIKKVIKECEICNRNKVKNKGGSIFIETSKKLEIVGVDILEIENTYILVGIDYFTRRAVAEIIRNKSAEKVTTVIENWCKQLGNPENIITDQGPEFKNAWMEDLCIRRSIYHHMTSTEHHEANGRVERLLRTIREAYRKDIENKGEMEEKIKEIINRYNDSKHSGIGVSPKEAWEMDSKELKNKEKSAYEKKFKKKNREKFIESQIIGVKEIPTNKENQRYGKTGKIIKVLDNDAYLVKCGDKIEKRHHQHLSAVS